MKNLSVYIWTIALLGLLTGGSTLVLFILLPFWNTLQPDALMTWFRDFGGLVGIVMVPMEVIPLFLSVYSYFLSRKSNEPGKSLWIGVNLSNIIILLMLIVYFVPVNLSFINGIINPIAVPAELAKWQMIHAVRTVFILLSMILAILAVLRTYKKYF